MTDDPSDERPRRREPTGEPVVRGDPEIVGDRAESAVEFDPADPESRRRAVETVRAFAGGTEHDSPVDILRGAAACATLVRSAQSYADAAEEAGDGVSVSFLQKWTRVHDLPIAIRRHIGLGDIVPSAAKHVARIQGTERYLLAWAIIDHDLTVREVRTVVGRVTEGESLEEVLDEFDARLGEITATIPVDVYHELRLETSAADTDADRVIAEALQHWFRSGMNRD